MGINSIINDFSLEALQSKEAEKSSSNLDKDAFLRLLVEQLKNQDPLDPLKNEDFIAQLAQFNSLEEMINLNESFATMAQAQQLSQASGLVGQTIAFQDSEGEMYTGMVESVTVEDGVPALQVGDHSVSLDDIIGLGQLSTASILSDSAYLIGKDVTYLDGDGNKATGLVKTVDLSSGFPKLIVGDDDVELGLSDILAVSLPS